MSRAVKWLRDNALSLSMLALFVAFLVAASWTGLQSYNQQQASQGYPLLAYRDYLFTGTFLDGLLVNWQAAILQLTVLIVFSKFLRQRGASHSLKPDGERRNKKPRRAPAGGRQSWIYRNSLSAAFAALFVVAFALHLVFAGMRESHRRALLHQPPADTASFVASSALWAPTFEAWQAEFFAMWFFLIASIYLRQEGSSESKAPEAGDDETGEPNE